MSVAQASRDATVAEPGLGYDDAVAAASAIAAGLGIASDPRAIDDVTWRRGAVTGAPLAVCTTLLGGLGIGARRMRLDPSTARVPWVTTACWRGGATVLVAVLGRRGRWLDVRTFGRDGAGRHRLTPSALLRAIGAPDAGTLEVVVATHGEPLARLHDPNGRLTPWRRAWRLAAIERDDIWVAIVYGAAIGLLSLVSPIAVQALVTTVAFGSVLQPLVVLTGLFAVVSAAAGALVIMRSWTVERIQQRLFVRTVTHVGRRLAAVPGSALDRVHVPDLMNRFFEVPNIQKALAVLLVDGVGLVLQTLVGVALLAYYHPMLMWFSLGLVVALFVVVVAFGRGAVESALEESRAKYATVGWLEHLARIPLAFKSARGNQLAMARVDELSRRYVDARHSHFRRLVAQSVGGVALAVVGSTCLLGLGGYLVMSNQLTLGQLIAAELVMAGVAAALLKLGKQLESTYDLVQATTKLAMLLDLPAERRSGEPLVGHGPLAVRALDLRHTHGARTVLSRVDVTIPAGTRVLVRGHGGAGKTTLLEILATMRPPTAGSIELDGCDVRLLDLADVRDAVVLVREPSFVDGTLLANLRLGRPDASLTEVAAVLAALDLTEAVESLPDGLATLVQPSGSPLSSSRARRVALARALLARPRLLLLDGTLDDLGLDPEASARVLEHVLRPDAPWTVVVVSQSAEVAARCDTTLVVADGKVEVLR